MLNIFLRQIARVASALREKPDTKLDEYLLEHYIVYHGLAGTTPDNLRQVKHVRQDILDAVAHKNSRELAIALKLPPLYWQDKLPPIFSEIKQQHGPALIECLLPTGSEFDVPPESDPLRHPDWRVRANAARMLAHLGEYDAIPRMVQALTDETPTQKAAFYHIATSLGALRSDQSKQALIEQLASDEPWFVLDAAAALSNWPLPEVAPHLAQALLSATSLRDYLSVALAQKFDASAMLASSDDAVQEGGFELALGLVEASHAAHCAEVPIKPAMLHRALPKLVELTRAKAHPRRLKAVLRVTEWMRAAWQDIVQTDRDCDAGDLLRTADAAANEFPTAFICEQVLNWLKANAEQLENAQEGKHAAELAGDLQIEEAAPYLISMAGPRHGAADEAIAALQKLKHTGAAVHLLKLAEQTVDIDDRTTRPRSAQPVFEHNPQAATTYWRILAALSAMPTPESVAYLLRARNDFAPDKRQQALHSLTTLAQSGKLDEHDVHNIGICVQEALDDPSTAVKVVALKGISDLRLLGLVQRVMPLVHAKDTPLRKQAQATLRQLHENGFGKEVKTAIASDISRERDRYKKERLVALLNSL